MSSLRADLIRERDALRSTLVELGPDAPTSIAGWTATDLAVHVAIGEAMAAVPNALFRALVRRGVRLDRMAAVNGRVLSIYRRRRGFEWAVARLSKDPPWLHMIRGVAPVSLLEVWAHHEDVLMPNGRSCIAATDLAPVVQVLASYHRRSLERLGIALTSSGRTVFTPSHRVVEVGGEEAVIARWLSGRAELSGLTVTGPQTATAAVAAEPMSI